MMTSKDYGVRVLRAYEFRRVGEVVYPPGILRDHLIRKGLVERVTAPEEQQATEQRPPLSRARRMKV